jgi:hypothetical protein
VGTYLRQDAALEEANVARLKRATTTHSPKPHRPRAVATARITPRPITDEVVG